MDALKVTAWLVGCEPNDLVSFKDYGDLGSAAIGPDGKKHIFTLEQLEKGDLAMNTPTLKEAAEAPASEAHAPKRRPERRTTKKSATKKESK